MDTYLSRNESQQVDRTAINQFGMSGLVLMENAAIGAVQRLMRRLVSGSPVLVIAGAGNNGGDGLAMARHLAILEVPVAVVWIGEVAKASDDCAANWKILQHTAIPTVQVASTELQQRDETSASLDRHSEQLKRILGIEHFAWIVDALLGTGAKGAARSPIDQVIRWINQQSAEVLAVDLPSGLDCDEGITGGDIVEAELTCTFVAKKKAFQLADVQDLLGQIETVSIGCPAEVIKQACKQSAEDHNHT